ncbi:hypothetical protein M1141_01835 [Candidatus Marsarchaeota archaeon]|nr:hypothetical protein [Candidatus Marsarchaeota archaeon]
MKNKRYRMKSEFESKRDEGNVKAYSYMKQEFVSTDTDWVKKRYNQEVKDAQKNMEMKKNDKPSDIKYKISLFDENNKIVTSKILKKPAAAIKAGTQMLKGKKSNAKK